MNVPESKKQGQWKPMPLSLKKRIYADWLRVKKIDEVIFLYSPYNLTKSKLCSIIRGFGGRSPVAVDGFANMKALTKIRNDKICELYGTGVAVKKLAMMFNLKESYIKIVIKRFLGVSSFGDL
jgi:hypothetical protein